MKIILLAGVAVLLLGGGGAGAYFYFNVPAEAAASDAHETVEKAPDKSKYEYVELDPLLLPIIDNNGVSQVVSVVVALEVSDSAAAAEVKRLSPRIKDAFIQDMYGVLNQHAALKGGVIQVTYLKDRLNKISTQVMGENVVLDVLLQVVQQRPV